MTDKASSGGPFEGATDHVVRVSLLKTDVFVKTSHTLAILKYNSERVRHIHNL